MIASATLGMSDFLTGVGGASSDAPDGDAAAQFSAVLSLATAPVTAAANSDATASATAQDGTADIAAPVAPIGSVTAEPVTTSMPTIQTTAIKASVPPIAAPISTTAADPLPTTAAEPAPARTASAEQPAPQDPLPAAPGQSAPSCGLEIPLKGGRGVPSKPAPPGPDGDPNPSTPHATGNPAGAPAEEGQVARDDARPQKPEKKPATVAAQPDPVVPVALANAAPAPVPVPTAPPPQAAPSPGGEQNAEPELAAVDPKAVRKPSTRSRAIGTADDAALPATAGAERGEKDQASKSDQPAALLSSGAGASSDAMPAVRHARHDDALSAFTNVPSSADSSSSGGTSQSPSQTVGQQVTATLIGGHDHQKDFAARLETLADQVFVHGRSQHEARFTVDATELGPVAVGVARDSQGVSVSFQTSSETARSAIADAQPRLQADARLAGLSINQSRVDSGGAQNRRGGGHGQQRSAPVIEAASVTTKTNIRSVSDRFA